jgi:hypothetical protein
MLDGALELLCDPGKVNTHSRRGILRIRPVPGQSRHFAIGP